MYCNRCDYPLNDLDSSSCPECGRPFSPEEPLTFRRHPRRRWLRRLVGAIATVFVLFIGIVTWYGWRVYQFERTSEWIESRGGSHTDSVLYQGIQAWGIPSLKVVEVADFPNPFDDADLSRLRNLTHSLPSHARCHGFGPANAPCHTPGEAIWWSTQKLLKAMPIW